MTTLTVAIPPRDSGRVDIGVGTDGRLVDSAGAARSSGRDDAPVSGLPRDAADAGSASLATGIAANPAAGFAGNVAGGDAAQGGLRYVLTDRRGQVLRSGVAPLSLLPSAAQTCLILAARDVLLVEALVPPLTGPRLLQALPNIIEESLLADSPPVHIAVAPPGSSTPAATSASASAADGKGGNPVRRLRRDVRRKPARAAWRTLAAVDQGWMRTLLERFTAAGHRAIRIVPLQACLPLADSVLLDGYDSRAAIALTVRSRAPEPAGSAASSASGPPAMPQGRDASDESAAAAAAAASGVTGVSGAATASAVSDGRDAALRGEGLQVPLTDLASTMGAVAPHHRVFYLADANGRPYRSGRTIAAPSPVPSSPAAASRASSAAAPALDPDPDPNVALHPQGVPDTNGHRLDAVYSAILQTCLAAPLTLIELAEAARISEFDLCQFGFAARGWRVSAEQWRQIRWPVWLLAASVVIAVLGINVRWLQLTHQRNQLQAAMTERLLSSFPSTTVVLDPAVQMTHSLDGLRVAAGALSPNDFLAQVNALALALGGIAPASMASLGYDGHALQVAFRADARIDADFAARLARQGLRGIVVHRSDGDIWTLVSGGATVVDGGPR